jgi:hypothetical protein
MSKGKPDKDGDDNEGWWEVRGIRPAVKDLVFRVPVSRLTEEEVRHELERLEAAGYTDVSVARVDKPAKDDDPTASHSIEEVLPQGAPMPPEMKE